MKLNIFDAKNLGSLKTEQTIKKIGIMSSLVLGVIAVGASRADAVAAQVVTVSNYAQLNSALADDNDVTGVEFSDDIQITGGTRIHPNKKSLEIDGKGHTLLENPNIVGSSIANLYISDENGTKDVTLKNVNIVGKNYYGTITMSTNNVNYNIENVTYTGPQFIYNPRGYCNFSGKNDFTIEASTGSATAEELAETSGVTIGGDFNLNFNSTGAFSAFWFDHTADKAPTFNVLDNANVSINSQNRQIFYSGKKTNMNIGTGADVSIQTPQPLFDAGWMGNLMVGEKSHLEIKRTGTNWLSYPTLRLDGQLQVMPDATFIIENAPETTAAALNTTANSIVNFERPALVDLKTTGNTKVMNLTNSTLSFNSNMSREWVNNDTDTPTVDLTTPLEAILSVNLANKKVVYTNDASSLEQLSITNANRLQFTK